MTDPTKSSGARRALGVLLALVLLGGAVAAGWWASRATLTSSVPQDEATAGTEQVVWAEPSPGYMHRGYEKLAEVRTYPQVTTLVNRIDWLGSFANETPFILAAEKLMEIEAPPRAQYIRTILFELSRLANIGLFLPLGMFLLLLVGTRHWFAALAAGIVLTSMIEAVQREIPGRVSDPRDVAANSIGMVVGIVLAVVLTLPATLRRRQVTIGCSNASPTQTSCSSCSSPGSMPSARRRAR